MKKIALVTVALMLFALAAPAMAAPQITTSGSMDSTLKYKQGVGMSSESQIKFDASLNADNQDGKAKVHVEFAPISLNTDPAGKDGKLPFGSLTPFGTDKIGLKIDKAYLQTTGAFWGNGPEVTTTIGDIDASYSPWVANVTDVEGVKVDGIKVADNNIGAFYAWKPATDENGRPVTDQIIGANASTSLSGIDLSGAIVQNRSKGTTAYVASGSMNPVENVSLSGLYAVDAANAARAINVNTVLNTIPGYTVKAGYRNIDATFNPEFATTDSKSDVVTKRGQVGFNTEISTQIQGIDVTGTMDRYNRTDRDTQAVSRMRDLGLTLATNVEGTDLSFEHKVSSDLDANTSTARTKLTASRVLNLAGYEVTGKYTYNTAPDISDGETIHTFEASTAANLAMFENVQLSGKLGTNGGLNLSDIAYQVAASYAAPNGMTLGAAYDNAGFSATAGLSMSF